MLLKNIHIFICGVLISVVVALNSYERDRGDEADERDEANAYVDALLDYLHTEPVKAQVLDPLHLPQIIKGKHVLQNIKVTGLSNLRRDSDVMIINSREENFYITDIIARNVSITMDFISKMLFFKVQGDAGFVYDDLTLRLILSESFPNFNATLLKVIREGNYYVKYNGYIMIGSMHVDLNNVLQNARKSILSSIEDKAREAFDTDYRTLVPYLEEKYRKTGKRVFLDYK